ncbi:MAG TPA: diacylglycerol kinase family protein, partial [Patescibacteria group bacterium]
MNDTKGIMYILNPLSQEGYSLKTWQNARKKFPQLPENPVNMVEDNILELIETRKPKIIAIAGGDGAINFVCRIVAKLNNKPLLSIIPMGTGNALSYCFGAETVGKALEVINMQKKKVKIDLIKTNIVGHDIGVMSLSVGVDARSIFHREDFRYIGWGAYAASALQSLFFHPEEEITFTIDHQVTLSAKASSLFIANSPVIGLNYVIAPNAKLNDGVLDCTLFSTKYAFIRNIRLHGFKHPLYTELGKVRF